MRKLNLCVKMGTPQNVHVGQNHQIFNDIYILGEMLPPAFTYFMDMSEFLRQYPHIAIKLGEDHKHLLQTFIEGKLQVESEKRSELIDTLEKERTKLNDIIKGLRVEVSGLNSTGVLQAP